MSGEICPICLHDEMINYGSEPRADGPRKDRYQCKSCGKRTVNPLTEGDPRIRAGRQKIRTSLTKADIQVFTAAQNATDIHEDFVASLEVYCKARGASLNVLPIRYLNPTSHWGNNARAQDWWADEIEKYLFGARRKVHKHCVVLGTTMVQLTAKTPTSGFETVTGGESCILGHPKMELRLVATPQQKLPKAVMTTGCCTVKNYIPSRAGQVGEHHHTFGAVVIEKDGDRFHYRQLIAGQDGTFIDLDKKYTPKGVQKTGRVPLLVMGDLHEKFVCPQVVEATFTNKNSIAKVLNPRRIVWHDLSDGYACNPHEWDNPYLKVAKYEANYDSIEDELRQCAAFLDLHASGDVENIVSASNHDDFLARWMKSVDWRKEPSVNAEFYLKTALAMVQQSSVTEKGYNELAPFPYWMEQFIEKAKVRFLGDDESYTVHGVEVGQHGHRGPNGARGTLNNYSKIGVKTIIGHSHTPGIKEGSYQVGTSSMLKLDYTSGPSSWLNTHGIVYENGKRCLINIIDGHWRL